jgi:hypothetical protein
MIECGFVRRDVIDRLNEKALSFKRKSLLSNQQAFQIFGGTCGGRTHDKRIKSPLLYQLS